MKYPYQDTQYRKGAWSGDGVVTIAQTRQATRNPHKVARTPGYEPAPPATKTPREDRAERKLIRLDRWTAIRRERHYRKFGQA